MAYGLTVATDDQLRDLRGDVLAAVGYVANWHFYATGSDYSELFEAPSPVMHFWSLAIEEQFYLLFPLLVVGALALGRGRVRVVAGALGIATAVPKARSYIDRSIAAPRLCFEPVAGSATNSRNAGGVTSQNNFVTAQGR